MPVHAKKEKPIEVDMSVKEASAPIKYTPKPEKSRLFQLTLDAKRVFIGGRLPSVPTA